MSVSGELTEGLSTGAPGFFDVDPLSERGYLQLYYETQDALVCRAVAAVGTSFVVEGYDAAQWKVNVSCAAAMVVVEVNLDAGTASGYEQVGRRRVWEET